MATAADGRFLAGGHALLPALKLRLDHPTDLIDLGAIAELNGVTKAGGILTIGAMTPHAEVANSGVVRACIPALANLAAGIGDPQVRNRATLGGSVAGNPTADYPAALLGLGATIHTDLRRIAADDFFVGTSKTALGKGEIVTAVAFPVPEKAAYAKFSGLASRYAIAGVFVGRSSKGVRVAVTGAGPCVFRHLDMERALAAEFAPRAIEGLRILVAGLRSDLHASAEYRAQLIGVMARRAIAACV